MPWIDQRDSRVGEMLDVARGQSAVACGDGSGDHDVTHFDWPTSNLKFGRNCRGFGRCGRVELQNPSFQILSQRLLERLLQAALSLAGRHERQTKSGLKNGNGC